MSDGAGSSRFDASGDGDGMSDNAVDDCDGLSEGGDELSVGAASKDG